MQHWVLFDKLEDAAGLDDAAELSHNSGRHIRVLADDRLVAVAAAVGIAQLAVLHELKLEKLVSKLAFVPDAVCLLARLFCCCWWWRVVGHNNRLVPEIKLLLLVGCVAHSFAALLLARQTNKQPKTPGGKKRVTFW